MTGIRKIEFRGRESGGTWLYGSLVELYHDYYIWANDTSTDITKGIQKVVADTVGQRTNREDKNGVAIYEDDILKCSDFDGVFVVCYDGGFGSFVARRFPGGYMVHLCSCEQNDIAVVGNIHDNPELLKLNDE